MDLGLAGTSFVLTAASRGLGLATARCLADDGASTMIVAREQMALDQAVQSLGPGATGLAADLSAPGSAHDIADAARERFGSLDGALINVGGPRAGSVLAYSDELWRQAIDSVLLATVRIARELVPLVHDGGSVLVVLSTTVKEPIPSLGASNVLRPGLAMLVKDLAGQLAPRGVRANGIMPGRIGTDRLRALYAQDPLAAADDEALIPLGRYGTPEEFGRAAAFLLSPAASYITGSLLAVDGGLLRSPW